MRIDVVRLVTAVAVAAPVVAQSQTAATSRPPAATPAPSTARFALTPSDSGLFLVDQVTGRVWRYGTLKISMTEPIPAPESEILKYLDNLIAADEAAIGRRYTDQERVSRREALRIYRKTEIEAMGTPPRPRNANPCQGLEACFIEVDRVRLTESGWSSEVLGK